METPADPVLAHAWMEPGRRPCIPICARRLLRRTIRSHLTSGRLASASPVAGFWPENGVVALPPRLPNSIALPQTLFRSFAGDASGPGPIAPPIAPSCCGGLALGGLRAGMRCAVVGGACGPPSQFSQGLAWGVRWENPRSRLNGILLHAVTGAWSARYTDCLPRQGPHTASPPGERAVPDNFGPDRASISAL